MKFNYEFDILIFSPRIVIEDEINIAKIQTRTILNPVSRFVELCREPSGFLIPIYLPKLIKLM